MSTSGKNRGILAGLVADREPVTDTPEPPRVPARLDTRFTGLARVTSGDVQEKTLQLVDPARCRMWARHNRRYDLLNEAMCSDLLESLRSQGVQEFPAIVRRVTDDPNFDFEVICGARRHWSVSFLRTVEHRENIKFLVDARELDDEAAFRLSDVENRSRRDITDYERALDYRHAVETYYGGRARRMAERMEVSEAWLSRFLDLAKLPAPIVEAYLDIDQLKERHARAIKPLLADPIARPRLMAAAKQIAEEQLARRSAGEATIDGAKVLEHLKLAAAGEEAAPKPRARADVVSNSAGVRLFTVTAMVGKATLEIALNADAPDADFHAAFKALLKQLRPKA